MHTQVEQYMEERDLSIVCLQETRVAPTTQYVVGNCVYVMHGHGGKERECAGVGFVIRQDMIKYITGFELGAEGRLMILGIDMAPRRLSLITVYVPQRRKEESEREDIIDELEKAIAKCQNKGATLIMWDVNARIHARLRGEDEVLGPHIYGGGVDMLLTTVWEQGGRTNREMLMDTCVAQELKVMNTWFEKPGRKKCHTPGPGRQRAT